MGKGSTPRPFEIPHDQFESNWERTFGKNKPAAPAKPPEKTPPAK